jgi:molybdopterin synthase catalytic subunit
MRVRLFAALRDAFGEAEVALPDAGPLTAGALLDRLAETRPDAAPLLARSRVAVDREFAAPDAELPAGAEIAIIPPVSGG